MSHIQYNSFHRQSSILVSEFFTARLRASVVFQNLPGSAVWPVVGAMFIPSFSWSYIGSRRQIPVWRSRCYTMYLTRSTSLFGLAMAQSTGFHIYVLTTSSSTLTAYPLTFPLILSTITGPSLTFSSNHLTTSFDSLACIIIPTSSSNNTTPSTQLSFMGEMSAKLTSIWEQGFF